MSDKQYSQDFINLVTTTWKGLTITAGALSGLFSYLTNSGAATIAEVAKHFEYDYDKLDLWFYFAEKEHLLEKKGDKYNLTEYGKYFSSQNPSKDLLAFMNITEYYLEAALNAKETFKIGNSIDMLTEGKISRNYQPKVSDNFSLMLVNYLKDYNVSPGESLLDLGCGNGSFLRIIAQTIPEIQLTGMDSNIFAIEKGKKEDKQLGLSGRIKLLVGNAEDELNEFADGSFDWVTAINVLHFYQMEKRPYLVENMMRIAHKGIFINTGKLDNSPFTSCSNTLMSLLWNDYTGFFRTEQLKEFYDFIQRKFSKYDIHYVPVLQGTSDLVIILKN